MSNSKTGSESENLSRIKDILFGEDLQGIEQKLAFFKKENAEINENLQKRFDDKLSSLEKTIANNAVNNEENQKKHVDSQSGIDKEIKQEITNINLELKSEKEKMESNLNAKTDEILEKISNLEKNLNQSIDKLKEEIEVKSDRLNNEKISKATIAALLTELAEKLKQ